MQSKGKSALSAKKICGSLQAKGENMKFNYDATIELKEKVEDVKEYAGQNLKGVLVHGTAVKEVVSRNGVKYLAKELEKATPSLKGRPILKDHKNDVDHIVGKVFDAQYNADEKAIKFKGLITDEKVKELVLNGLVNHVSIGASVKNLRQEESNNEKVMIAEGLEILELSVTPVPGIQSATIMPGENFAIALQEAYDEKDDEDTDDWDDTVAMKNKAKTPIIEKTKEENKMDEESIKIAREALADAILAFDATWKKEELVKFDTEALKTLLAKAKTPKVEEKKAEPKGMVETPVLEKKEEIIRRPYMIEGMIKASPGQYVVETKTGGKASIWKMPDYKKQLKY